MEYKIKIVYNGLNIGLDKALKMGLVSISNIGLVANEKVEIRRFCGVYDINGAEIYVGDILENRDKKIFELKEVCGTVYLYQREQDIYKLIGTIYSLQETNIIDYVNVSA